MKSIYLKIAFSLLAVMLAIGVSCSDTLWDDLPDQVSDFINRYFPGQSIESEGWDDDATVYTVKLRDSDLITFDKVLAWRSVNGRGSTVPQMFLFDELPPALYEYLQSMEALSGVYRVERTSSTITVELLNSTVIYNRKNGAITIPVNGETLSELLI